MPSPGESLLFLVIGGRGAGKTTFCAALSRQAQAAGWDVAGLISHAVFDGSMRVAIETEDIRTGDRRRLAARNSAPDPRSRDWIFDDATIHWGNHVLIESTPCDLLIVDELGPLELERDEGWQAGQQAIDSGEYTVALVVIRPELIGNALLRWPDSRMIEIETPEESQYRSDAFGRELFKNKG